MVYPNDHESGYYSDRPSSEFPSGSAAQMGALERERFQRQQNYTRQPVEAGGDGGAGLFVAVLLLAGIGFVMFHKPSPEVPVSDIHAGSSYQVHSCQFAGVKPSNSHVLNENEWVVVNSANGGRINVTAYKRPYDGTSAWGSINAECLKKMK